MIGSINPLMANGCKKWQVAVYHVGEFCYASSLCHATKVNG